MIELSPVTTIFINIIAWFAIHMGMSYIGVQLSLAFLERDGWICKERVWERDGKCYEKIWIKRWKDKLPEAGGLYRKGFQKRTLKKYESSYLYRFLLETKRGELTHWLSIPPAFLFFLWNHPTVGVIMLVYGIIVNLPFIVVQRYNRIRLTKLLRKKVNVRAKIPSPTFIEEGINQ
ncbi:glycosyl-4,4'-diaponeurosporenoate acyltransferase [Bacillus sp. CGMCC 1.16541]|uniref:glycosyl-4,4'-diaponeurosporenoate acyltransferase CrtO family protein n=1 Tax=Bacillus sp. CGMCC 1.16541 TaxID=2185143 RepID=UPI000D73C893|nr:glycosyl-4,4'-diaponeurosporenoate acyltransferase [Bacillus sp. CGMCC 1.16541]